MREELLHYIWKYKKFPVNGLMTSENETIEVLHVGNHNHLSGPDFFNAQLKIGGQLWAGNVEVHIKSSDWYAHKHENDENYDNVILHVVWENDVSVFRKDNSEIPALQLKDCIPEKLLQTYKNLFENKEQRFIACGKEINGIPEFTFANWMERLFFERLEQKAKVILKLLKASKNDWEKVLFVLLLKNFGSKINGDLFFEVGNSLDFSIVRKLYRKPIQMEALLMGVSGLLESDEIIDSHYIRLKEEFKFLKNKFQLATVPMGPPDFFKLRPSNFPTLRLAQLAGLYAANNNLFNSAIVNNDEDLKFIFKTETHIFWDDHYTFGKRSKKRKKNISQKFIDLLVINTILPLRFCYLKSRGIAREWELLTLIEGVNSEDNSIVKGYEELGVPVKSAKDSQSLLQLYNQYCSKNKCLQCAVGSELLNLKS
ncbi:DUF2851 family protein [Maribacter sp. 2304DJ31-5]|uniref:DUF2851 family protein n=1 Tax=Maribacter sp. 2304DJ31-5 TaxID=3386273 RepID=UPI0039BC53F3